MVIINNRRVETMVDQSSIRIEKGTVQETLIIPLYARKKCTDKFPLLYDDPMASKICSMLDYDFSELDKLYEKTAYEFGAMEAALRQMDMMWEINDYIAAYPDASIVCMGCGLDFDARRCGSDRNHIFNIDFPDVIETREKLAQTGQRETNIAADLTDHRWMEKIDAQAGAVFFAAGVFHYLKREDFKALVVEMANRFPGCRLVFDTVGKFGHRMMMKAVLTKHGILSGAVEPAFGLLTIVLASIIVPVLPYLLAFAAGAMIYVVVEELIPEMSKGTHSHTGVVMFAAGFTLMMVLDVALG